MAAIPVEVITDRATVERARASGKFVTHRAPSRNTDFSFLLPKPRAEDGGESDLRKLLGAPIPDDAPLRFLTLQLLNDGHSAEARARIAHALLDIGGPLAERNALGLALAGGFRAYPDILWRIDHIDARRAVELWRDSGLPVDETELRQAVGDCSGEEFRAFLTCLRRSRVLLRCDEHVPSQGAHYDELVVEFARHAHGLLPLEGVRQVAVGKRMKEFEDPAYRLECVLGKKLFRVTARHMSSSHDLEAVAALLDRALEETGREERFVPLSFGGDGATYVCGDPERVAFAAKALFLPTGPLAWLDAVHALSDRLHESGSFEPGLLVVHAFVRSEMGEAELLASLEITVGRFGLSRSKDRAFTPTSEASRLSAMTIELEVQPEWTQIWLRPSDGTLTDEAVEPFVEFFEALCRALPTHLARVSTVGEFGRVREAELVGAIDWLDWLQYFDARLAKRLKLDRRGRPWIDARFSDSGDCLLRIGTHPFARRAFAREAAGAKLDVRLRDVSSEQPPTPPTEVEPWDDEAALERVRADGSACPGREALSALDGEDVPRTIRRLQPFIEVGLYELSKGPEGTKLLGNVARSIRKRSWPEVEVHAATLLKAAAIWGGEKLAPLLGRPKDVSALRHFVRGYSESPLDTGMLDRLASWDRFYEDPTALVSLVRALGRDEDKRGRHRRHDQETIHGVLKLLVAFGIYEDVRLSELVLMRTLRHEERIPMLRKFVAWPLDNIRLYTESDASIRVCPCEWCCELKPLLDDRRDA